MAVGRRPDSNEPAAVWRKERLGNRKNFVEWIDLSSCRRCFTRRKFRELNNE